MAVLSYTTLGGIVAAAPNVASDVTTAFTQAQTSINNVESAQIVNGTIGDAKLASPNNTVWREVGTTVADIAPGYTAATYWITGYGTPVSSGTAFAGGARGYMPQSADYAVSGKTTTFRLNTTLAVSGTAPGVTLTFGLHPVTATAGSGGNISYTIGAAVAGSTTAFASPSSGTQTRSASSGFAISALTSTTLYVIGCVLSGTVAANSLPSATCMLQVSHV
jgi:hypothetical protein